MLPPPGDVESHALVYAERSIAALTNSVPLARKSWVDFDLASTREIPRLRETTTRAIHRNCTNTLGFEPDLSQSYHNRLRNLESLFAASPRCVSLTLTSPWPKVTRQQRRFVKGRIRQG